MNKAKTLAVSFALMTGATAATVTLATPANAATTCYGQSPTRVATDAHEYQDAGGTYWRSGVDWYVDQDSACHDVNLSRSWNDVAQHGQCVDYRIRFGIMPQAATAWKAVCWRWTVIFPNVPRGVAFTLESRSIPASAVVRA